jgi:hypothetical protein|tara:strand:+ start:253 stop:444 length:192 start_codon:yes stop_codon:yes gene_type:complete
MRTFDQDDINEGALIITLLIKTIIEVDTDRPRNEADDKLMTAAMEWVEEFSEKGIYEIEITEH